MLVEDTRKALVPLCTPKEDKQYAPFTAILDRLVVRRLEGVQKGKLGVPDNFRQQTNKGEVLYVGDGVFIGGQMIPMPVKPGDRVLFGEYNCEHFDYDGEKLEIVRIQDVRGVERLITETAQEEKEEIPCFDTFPGEPPNV